MTGQIAYALVDANNFYASCERAFNPALWGVPVVVLSNNDGCIIARSNEAKALGIAMGAPYWELRDLIREHRVKVCSSNYPLYGDMSERVMGILQAHCADMEVYSIDEAFLRLGPLRETEETLLARQVALRETILRSTGIPVSIGVAPTKTLAKLANRLAKSQSDQGVYVLSPGAAVLSEMPVEKVWGVAGGYKKRLAKIGVETVSQLAQAPQEWIQREFGVVGVRILKELQGFPALELEPPVAARQNVMVSRSFSKDVYALSEIIEAVSTYAARVGEKLRALMRVCDELNGRMGRNTVYLASCGHRKKQGWSRREQWSSPRYTTRWEEILRVGDGV